MEAERVISIAFLAVSIISLGWQGTSLHRLYGSRPLLLSTTYSRLHRTAVCRVGVSILYVGVGVNALFLRYSALEVAFAVFCITQIVWWINSAADIRLIRRLPHEISKRGKSDAQVGS